MENSFSLDKPRERGVSPEIERLYSVPQGLTECRWHPDFAEIPSARCISYISSLPLTSQRIPRGNPAPSAVDRPDCTEASIARNISSIGLSETAPMEPSPPARPHQGQGSGSGGKRLASPGFRCGRAEISPGSARRCCSCRGRSNHGDESRPTPCYGRALVSSGRNSLGRRSRGFVIP